MKRTKFRDWPAKAKIVYFIALGFGGVGLTMFFMGNEAGTVFNIIAIMLVFYSTIITRNEEKAKQAEKQREEQRMAPYLRDEEYQTMLAHCEGLEKYYKMAAYEEEKNREAAETLRKMGGILQQSVYQEKEKDWAVRGGIASGIGGLGAGVAAAVDAMQDNERIRKENADRREWGKQQNDHHEQLARQVEAKRIAAPSMYQLQRDYDVDLSWKPETLLEYIFDGRLNHVRHRVDEDTGVVHVSVTLGNYASMMIDGSLRGKLYTQDGKCAGCAYIPLPVGGIFNDVCYAGGFCAQPKYPGPYKVKVEAANLWTLLPKGTVCEWKSDGISDEQHRKLVAEAEQRFLAEVNKEYA